MSDGPESSLEVRHESDLPPHMRRWVASVLRGGVILASALLIIGLILWAIEGAPPEGTGGVLGGGSTLTAGISSGPAFAFLVTGLLVLVLTPLARVGVALGLFAQARDRAFALISAFVLVVLLLSVLLGLFGFQL